MNIYEKLLAITSEIKKVAKNLEVGVGQSQYKAVGEADVLTAVKELEEKYKVYSYPFSREIVDTAILQTEKEYNKKITRSNQIFMRLKTVYRFVNIEKPEEYIDVPTYGDGVDTQDKAPGKAMTYGDKYALMKAYKIITGDDPDQTGSPDNMNIVNKNGTKKSTNNKVTDVEAKSIYALMVRKGIDVVHNLQKNYGISNTADLTKEQYLSIFKAINNMPDKKIEQQQLESEMMDAYAAYYDANADMGDRE
ncbi:MAG: ERF family protein [Clostridia bacterium]|jgi:hypothetical protein